MATHGGFIILLLIFWLVPAYLVYVHAKNRGRDAGLWAAVVLVGGLLGILLYFILAGSGDGGRRTPPGPDHGAGTPGGSGDQQSGWDTEQSGWDDEPAGAEAGGTYCQQCGEHNDAQANYCSQCGSQLRT